MDSDEEATAKSEGSATMKWYIGVIVGLCLLSGASVSQGEWRMRIHRGATVEEQALADIDSLTFYEDMVLVPADTSFSMGSPEDEPGRIPGFETLHQVTLTKAIFVSMYEVTQSEWQAVMPWNPSGHWGASRPVDQVNWFDAVSYCNERSIAEGYTPAYMITDVVYIGPPAPYHIASATVAWNQAANGYRLLTEAEWEYACRATSAAAFCNGGITNVHCSPLDPNLDQVGWYCGNEGTTTHDVGTKTANAWGLKDMHGNVQEWCWDWFDPSYQTGPLTDPIGPESGLGRVLRGGYWWAEAEQCRSAIRDPVPPGALATRMGLRVCRTAP
jgi:formylglycine-generating enzyme required for sulfatase activity